MAPIESGTIVTPGPGGRATLAKRGKAGPAKPGKTVAKRKPEKKRPGKRAGTGAEFAPETGWRASGKATPGRAPSLQQAKHRAPKKQGGRKSRIVH